MTEGVSSYFDIHQSTQQLKNFFTRTQTDARSFYENSPTEMSKSTHSVNKSILASEFDHFGRMFEAENDRIRQVLDSLEKKNKSRKLLTENDCSATREGVSDKIKKQNILLKTGFGIRPPR